MFNALQIDKVREKKVVVLGFRISKMKKKSDEAFSELFLVLYVSRLGVRCEKNSLH